SLIKRPFFLPSFMEDFSKQLPDIEAIVTKQKQRLLSLSNSEWADFQFVNRFFFVLDANISELEGTQTFEESEQALCPVSSNPTNLPTTHQVTRNLWDAAIFLFGDIDRSIHSAVDDIASEFTPSLACQLHSIVCRDLLPSPGSYRLRPARPANEPDFYYAPPEEISDRLNVLFANCRAAIRSDSSLLETVHLAASFIEQYLAIHPFSDGNGRTARLLCALLLRPLLLEPVSICLANSQSRDIFLRCLREARGPGGHVGLLTAYLLASVDRAVTSWIEWLYCCSKYQELALVDDDDADVENGKDGSLFGAAVANRALFCNS
ncbi:hypothetical protein BOX15_Mlig021507g1, partial [Macrostomum lignano]